MEHPKTASHVFVGLLAFAFGSIVTSNIYSFLSSRKRIGDRENAGASREFNDLSFFYGDEKALTTVERNCSHLPGDFYGQLVRDCIVACVDCVIVRVNAVNDTKQCILVERKDEPMKVIGGGGGNEERSDEPNEAKMCRRFVIALYPAK